MIWLWPTGGDMSRFPNDWGCFTSPQTGITAGMRQGRPYCIDNECFNRPFSPPRFFTFLEKCEQIKTNCLFVVVPDYFNKTTFKGCAKSTLNLWRKWSNHPYLKTWPLAFVAQDGQENYKIPDNATCLFVGGSTEWKESYNAVKVIQEAQSKNIHVHIGRVNWARRYNLFAGLAGSEKFTCDGTRPRFGRDKCIIDWERYQNSEVTQLRLI